MNYKATVLFVYMQSSEDYIRNRDNIQTHLVNRLTDKLISHGINTNTFFEMYLLSATYIAMNVRNNSIIYNYLPTVRELEKLHLNATAEINLLSSFIDSSLQQEMLTELNICRGYIQNFYPVFRTNLNDSQIAACAA